jgi:hypothetical protein
MPRCNDISKILIIGSGMNSGQAGIALAVLLVASGCHRARSSAVSQSAASAVQRNGLMVYSSARPDKQKPQESSSVTFRVPAPQELSGVLKDPQGAVIASLKMELACAGFKRAAETDYYGKYNLGSIQSGECTITFGPGPWIAPTVECSTESCVIDPKLTLKRGMNKVIEN